MNSRDYYQRNQASVLMSRLQEPDLFMQVIFGARQVGKTTLAKQAAKQSRLPYHYATADLPGLKNIEWIAQQWQTARNICDSSSNSSAILRVPS